jgi:hypothetical protein|tara:strand:- start:154 stop:336 length:183 start_codon:yes stop_codon:yes gene_type:complete
MTQSLYVVEKQNLKTDYRQLVGVYDSRELADAGGEESLEMNDPDNWNITVTIVPLNGKLG